MLDLESAQQRILSLATALGDETVPLSDAAGRYLAAPVLSRVNLPGFDNSAMDGYAVRSEDATHATAGSPVILRLAGLIPAGGLPHRAIDSGTCARIFTGSPLPPGADAVVMQEDTRPEGEGCIAVLDRVRPFEHVRLRGEDVKEGAVLAEPGEKITAASAGLFAATGVARVTVGKRPLAGLIATGSELREPCEELAAGQIYESNRAALRVLAEEAGCRTKLYPIAADDPDSIERLMAQALKECDVVITSGGVSVGDFDYVKPAIERLGGTLDFWKVAIKPGKPFTLGKCRGKFLFGLPGNPVSAFVTFLLLVRPALLWMQGASDCLLPSHPARLAGPLANRGDRRHFMRVRVDEEGNVTTAGAQASHMLWSLRQANALIDVPPETEWPAGTPVRVLRWE